MLGPLFVGLNVFRVGPLWGSAPFELEPFSIDKPHYACGSSQTLPVADLTVLNLVTVWRLMWGKFIGWLG